MECDSMETEGERRQDNTKEEKDNEKVPKGERI
jgi:hypothetical protein